jgi:hypothetical protein
LQKRNRLISEPSVIRRFRTGEPTRLHRLLKSREVPRVTRRLVPNEVFATVPPFPKMSQGPSALGTMFFHVRRPGPGNVAPPLNRPVVISVSVLYWQSSLGHHRDGPALLLHFLLLKRRWRSASKLAVRPSCADGLTLESEQLIVQKTGAPSHLSTAFPSELRARSRTRPSKTGSGVSQLFD